LCFYIHKFAEMIKLFGVLFLMFGMQISNAKDVSVSTGEQLDVAFRGALPGTRIVLLPGNYNILRLDTYAGGTAQYPIIVEASIPGEVLINATGSETISVHHPYWVFKDLVIKGSSQSDHAFHVTNNADNIVIKRNTLIDFHAQIKVNGENQSFPDNGLIEDNDIFNTEIRHTDQPVTPIDIVGGKDWVIRGNYVADFSKGLSDKTSYGIFIKGNSINGLIERNLVICSKDTVGGIRIGMSFGGGGSTYAYCEKRDCSVEHSNGLMRNNVILNCSDVGIYLNKAREAVVENNTLLMTMGIDVRFPISSAVIKNNILTGAVRNRDGGEFEIKENLILGTRFGMWLPAISNKIQYRISDYDSKFSSSISRKNVEELQLFVDNLFSFLEKTWVGLGQNKTQLCFPGLAIGNVRPDKNECGIFWESSDLSSSNPEDFWGNKRSTRYNVMGAIDFYHSTCNILDRIQHRSIKLSSACLD
jgi:parallel beta-helix repeat protein